MDYLVGKVLLRTILGNSYRYLYLGYFTTSQTTFHVLSNMSNGGLIELKSLEGLILVPYQDD